MYVFLQENVFILTQGNTDLNVAGKWLSPQSLGVDPEGQNHGASRRHACSEPAAPAPAGEPGAASTGAAAVLPRLRTSRWKVGAGRCAATGFSEPRCSSRTECRGTGERLLGS